MLLLIDDDDLFRGALASNLRDDGFRVEERATAAVRIDGLCDICVLLIDWAIERSRGKRFVERFQEMFPTVPVIVITRNAKRAIENVTAHSRIRFLPKPLRYETLVETLCTLGSPC